MILQTIPLIQAPNQILSVTLGSGQSVTLTIRTLYANNKSLIGEDADPDASTIDYTYCTVNINNDDIIINAPVIHAQYINQYRNQEVERILSGYLFFYVSSVDTGGSDKISYTNFGKTTLLYWSDKDILAGAYDYWVKQNLKSLQQKFIYKYQ